MKKIFAIAMAAFGLFLAIAASGLYPAVVVDGSVITFRSWRKLEESSKRFANAERARRGERALNYDRAENSALLAEGRRETLAALIEAAIIAEEGRELVPDFDQKSEQKIVEALRRAPNFKRGVESLYGISYDDFKELVLLPQARTEILKEALDKRNINFEEWFGETKRRAKVRLFLTGFRWTGAGLE